MEFQIKIQMLEIYMEQLKDLMEENDNIKIRNDAKSGVVLEGLSERFVSSYDEILELY